MSIVDLAKARAFADRTDDETAADWIRELTDEVESQERALMQERRDGQDLADRLGAAEDERDALFAALTELYGSISELLAEIGQAAS
jgi:hypothetical protein